jgi:hypothetical protein
MREPKVETFAKLSESIGIGTWNMRSITKNRLCQQQERFDGGVGIKIRLGRPTTRASVNGISLITQIRLSTKIRQGAGIVREGFKGDLHSGLQRTLARLIQQHCWWWHQGTPNGKK